MNNEIADKSLFVVVVVVENYSKNRIGLLHLNSTGKLYIYIVKIINNYLIKF